MSQREGSMSLCVRRDGWERRGGRRAVDGERGAATTLREYKEYEDKEAIMGEVRHGTGRERKGEKENQGTEQKTSIKRLVNTGTP